MIIRPTYPPVMRPAFDPIAGAGGLPWSPRAGTSGAVLFTYASTSITFTRASEAAAVDPRNSWLWYDTVTPWPGSDARRILPDGAIFIEGASTNRILQASALSTSPWGGNTSGVSTGQADPTGSTGACRITLTNAQEIDQTYAGDVAAARVTTVYQKLVGTGYYAIYAVRSGSLGQEIHGNATTSWVRYNTIDGTTNGANPTQVSRIYWEGRGTSAQGFGPAATAIDVLAFNAQAEDGAIGTSPIRTTVAEATRAIDVCALAAGAVPSAIKAGRWSIDIWPIWATANAPATAYIYYLDASNYLAIVSGNTLRCRANGSNFDVGSLTFVANAKRTITVNFGADTLAIDGASAVALTNDWSGSSAALSIGSDGSANAFWGVMSMAR